MSRLSVVMLALALFVAARGDDADPAVPAMVRDTVFNASPNSVRFGELLGSLMRQTCSGLNGNCSTKDDCCGTRFCNRSGKCRRCRVKGDTCSFDSMCCLGRVCTKSRCRDAVVPECQPKGGDCTMKGDCCTGVCLPNGKCGSCRRRGKRCTDTDQCCFVSNPKGLRCFANRCVGCTSDGAMCSNRRPCCGDSTCVGNICMAPSVMPRAV